MNVKTYQRFHAGRISIVIQPPKNIIVAIKDAEMTAFVRISYSPFLHQLLFVFL